jgi:hypothetical protein
LDNNEKKTPTNQKPSVAKEEIVGRVSNEADKLPLETKPEEETGVVDNEKKTEQIRQSGQPR